MKNKVGRPKLADSILKKESIIISVLCFLIIAMLLLMGFKTIFKNGFIGKMQGSVLKTNLCNINSYKLDEKTVKVVMICDKKVLNAKLDDTNLTEKDSYLYAYKNLPLGEVKYVNYSYKINNIKVNKKFKINNN